MSEMNILSDVNAESINWNVQDQFKGLSLEEIRNIQPKLPFSVCMLNTTGSLNIGVALRSAVLFGASKFYIAGRRRFDKRSTVGAQNYIDVERIDAIDENGKYDTDLIVNTIQEDGYSPIMIETGEKELSLDMLMYHEKWKNLVPCFFFGEEKAGIPKDLLDDFPIYTIPTIGVLRSLNVSIAASIVLYEAAKFYRKI